MKGTKDKNVSELQAFTLHDVCDDTRFMHRKGMQLVGLLACCAALAGCITANPHETATTPQDNHEQAQPAHPKEDLPWANIDTPSIRIVLVDENARTFESGDIVCIRYETALQELPKSVRVFARLTYFSEWATPTADEDGQMISFGPYEVLTTNVTQTSGQLEVPVEKALPPAVDELIGFGILPKGPKAVGIALYDIEKPSQLSNITAIKVQLK